MHSVRVKAEMIRALEGVQLSAVHAAVRTAGRLAGPSSLCWRDFFIFSMEARTRWEKKNKRRGEGRGHEERMREKKRELGKGTRRPERRHAQSREGFGNRREKERNG